MFADSNKKRKFATVNQNEIRLKNNESNVQYLVVA